MESINLYNMDKKFPCDIEKLLSIPLSDKIIGPIY